MERGAAKPALAKVPSAGLRIRRLQVSQANNCGERSAHPLAAEPSEMIVRPMVLRGSRSAVNG